MTLTAATRMTKLEQHYDTTDRDAAAERIRALCAEWPALAGHEEAMIKALLSRYPQYEVCVPDGSINPVRGARAGETRPFCREWYLILWWGRPAVPAPIVMRCYFDGGHRPGAPEPEPEPAPEPEPELSAYERLMNAAVQEHENGASDQ